MSNVTESAPTGPRPSVADAAPPDADAPQRVDSGPDKHGRVEPRPVEPGSVDSGLGEDEPSCAATLALAVVFERGTPSSWRDAPVRQGLSSAIIDAVMTPRVMTNTVDAVVARHEAAFGAGSASELLHTFELLGEATWRREIGSAHRTHASLQAPYKSEVIAQAAALLVERGIETAEDLCASADDVELRAAWCALPGQSTGFTWRHLLLAAGYNDLIVCPLTRTFARRTTGRSFTDDELRDVIVDAAAQLAVAAPALEHQMWRGALTAKRRHPTTRDGGAVPADDAPPPPVNDQP